MRTNLPAALFFIVNFTYGQTWTRLPDFPGVERDDGVAVTVNNKGYFGTGFRADLVNASDFYVLDPSADSWTPVSSIPVGRQYACAWPGPDCFFVFGGSNATGVLNDLYKYDLSTNTWSLAGNKPGTGLYGASCMEFGDKIILIGGKELSDSEPTNNVWEYTISSNTWLQKSNFPYGGRFRAGSTALNGIGYLLFGANDHDHFPKKMVSYNPSTDVWSALTDVPQTATRVYVTLKSINNALILFSGIDSTLTCYKDVWYYHPDNFSWTQSPDFPSFARKGGMGTVIGNTFYYSCGIDQNNNRLKETWMTNVPVSIKENFETDLFSLFPNPTQNMVCITSQFPERLKSVTLTDVAGKELKQPVMTTENKTTLVLNLEGILNGIYFIKILRTDGITEWKRCVKE